MDLELNTDGLRIPVQDLSGLNAGSEDNGRLFHHNGSSTITLVSGATTTEIGLYKWDNGAGAWEPVTYDHPQSVMDDFAFVRPAALDATSGNGMDANLGTPYQGGVQTAYDTLANQLDSYKNRPPKAVVLSGRHEDTISVPTGGFTLNGVGENWHNRLKANASEHVYQSSYGDEFITNIWLEGNSTSTKDIINFSGDELFAKNVEIGTGGNRRGITINGGSNVILSQLTFEGGTNDVRYLYCNDATNVQADSLILKGSDSIQIDGNSSAINLSNIIMDGELIIGGSASGSPSNINLYNITNDASGNGVYVKSEASFVQAYGVTVKNAVTRGFNISGNKTVIYGRAYNSQNNEGVLFNGSSNSAFIGHTSENPATGVKFDSNSTQCMAIGSFVDGVVNNGTRCIVNGNSVNSGDPSSGGDWNGYSGLAYRHGVTVWDTSTSPATPYRATPSGTWVQD